MFPEGFQIPKAAELINKDVLVKPFLFRISHRAGRGNEFHIDLNTLAGVLHLLVRFRDILGIGQLGRPAVNVTKPFVQTGDGACVSMLPQLHLKNHQTRMRVSAAHILHEGDFLLCMLIEMMVRPMRAVCQRADGTIILFTPAVDVLAARFVPHSCFCHSMFTGILLIPHVLCYLIHSE